MVLFQLFSSLEGMLNFELRASIGPPQSGHEGYGHLRGCTGVDVMCWLVW